MNHVEEAVRAIAAYDAAQDVLQALLRGSHEAAPRGAIYLVRAEGICGWSSYGYSRDAAFAQRAFACPPDEGWLGRLAASAADVALLPGHGGPPAPDAPEAAETMASVVRVRDKVVAILVGQRATGETPWCPYTLGLLVTVAALRLRLSLAERRSVTPVAPAAGTVAPTVAADAALRPVDEPSPRIAAARRYARLLATDIRLYNEEAVVLGRQHGDLVERLRDSLERGRATFLERHAELGEAGLELLHDAYVQVLAGGEADLLARRG
jgi:hypothetical protein